MLVTYFINLNIIPICLVSKLYAARECGTKWASLCVNYHNLLNIHFKQTNSTIIISKFNVVFLTKIQC